ncbi:3-oxoacyl-[acyl-carrier-protein] reductase [candidate division KSB1 bacterium]|nr:MAG: 3-oxoacyl-[acyl-carrier-protein] reductase [candidate division KSB1 bacterium]
MCDSLKDKTVWITGAARGIGLAIAQEMAARGANLMLTDVLESELADAALAIENAHSVKILHEKLDVTDGAGADRIVQRCLSELGGLTALVNNAGITRDGLMIRMSDDDWDRVLSVNLKGTFVCTRAAVKVMMKARYGKIVNIASVIGVMGNAGQANYAASKAGIIGLTKTVAKEFGARGVRANAVAPGFIQTEMTDKLAPETREAYLKAIPLNYLGTPQDVARICAFLVSADSDYITGQVIVADGGMHT